METAQYSEDVQQILTDPEPEIARYGPYLLLGLLCCLLVIVCLVKYPERLESEITITSEIPPTSVKASITKPLQQLFVTDKSRVEKGQLLAILDNAAHYRDVIKLKEWLGNNTAPNQLSWPDSVFTTTLALGNIQTSYALFTDIYQQYKLYQTLQPDHQQYQQVKTQIAQYHVDKSDLERIQSKLSLNQDEQIARLYVALLNARSNLSNEIESYERNYLIRAPITGVY